MQPPFQPNNTPFGQNNPPNSVFNNTTGNQPPSLFNPQAGNTNFQGQTRNTPQPGMFMPPQQLGAAGLPQGGPFGQTQAVGGAFPLNQSQQFGSSSQPFGNAMAQPNLMNGALSNGINANASTLNPFGGSTPQSSFNSGLFNVQHPQPQAQANQFTQPPQLNQSAQPQSGVNLMPANPMGALRPAESLFSQNQSTAGLKGDNTSNSGIASTIGDESANHSSFISSMKDNTVNLYNLKLQEIIDMQVAALDKNTKEFKKVAQAVFERDMKLIKAKNSYLETKAAIEQEEARLDELDEGLECLSRHLDGLPTGAPTEMGRCCDEFESVCDRFYKQLEVLKDDQDEVMDLVNENYMLIEAIDHKLDMLEHSYE